MDNDEATSYTITVVGELDAEWSDWLAGLTMATDNHTPPTTVLRGSLDQPALRGVLNRIWDLNLALVSVVPVQDGPLSDEMGGCCDG